MRRRTVARERGVTLIEVLIVVAIITLISAGIAAAVFPYLERSRTKAAATNARHLRAVVKMWWTDHDPSTCPSVAQLVDDDALDRDSPPADPWGRPWRVECDGHDVTVSSDGGDRTAGTVDDIRIPPA